MRRRALLMGGKEKLPLIIRVDTTKSGATPSDTFRIPANAPGETYRFKVDWGDGVITSNHTGPTEHTYAIGGVYDIKIYGKFPRFYFNNSGDRLKLIEVIDWGDIKYSTNQTSAFYGCENLTFIATDENAWYNSIITGSIAFMNCALTSLPDNMELPLLNDGGAMFLNNSLTSLPINMELPLLTNGNRMFEANSLTSLPSGMTLGNLTNGRDMFLNNSLTSLPNNMELPLLTNGQSMFLNNSLTSLPNNMELPLLTNGNRMFNANSLTSLPVGMTLASLTNGGAMFWGNTINTARYSQLLIDMEALNPNNNVLFGAGNSKYNKTAEEARQLLIARGWSIIDGGLE